MPPQERVVSNEVRARERLLPKKSLNFSNSPKKQWIYRHIHPFFLYILDLMVYIIVIGCLNKAINAID